MTSSKTRHRLTEVQEVQATKEAFAAIRLDGSVVTWGSSRGGNSREVQDQLQNVKAIQSTAGGVSSNFVRFFSKKSTSLRRKLIICPIQNEEIRLRYVAIRYSLVYILK